MSDVENNVVVDERARKSVKNLKLRVKDLEERCEALQETVETFGTIREENKRLKNKVKELTKDVEKLYHQMEQFLPKNVPVSIDIQPIQEIETPEREFKLAEEQIFQYRASDFIKNEFLTSKDFAKCNRDLIKFTVEAVALFLKKNDIKDVDWTVTTSDKGKSKYQEFPAEFIQDIVYLGMVGSGSSAAKREWGEKLIQYDRALSRACGVLQQRLNKQRSDGNRKRRRPDGDEA